MSEITKEVKSELSGIKSGLNELKDKENEIEERKVNPRKIVGVSTSFLRFTLFIGILVLFLLLLLRMNLLGSVDFIVNLFSLPFGLYDNPTVWGISAQAYIALVIGYLTIAIYGNIIVLLPLLYFEYFLRAKDNTKEKTMKTFEWEVLLFLILLLPMGTTALWANTFQVDGKDPLDTINAQKQSFGEKLVSGPFCYIINSGNPNICIKKENSAEIETKTIEKYLIRLEQPPNPYFELPYLLEEKIPVVYSFETGKNGILVEKLECYQNDIKASNLLDTVEINKVITAQNKKNEIFKCSAEKIKIDQKINENFEIKTILYLKLDTDFEFRIPLVNYELYKEKVNEEEGETVFDEAKKELGSGNLFPTNNALKYTIENSQFPIVINSPGESNKEYDVTLTFEEDILNNLGDLKKSSLTKFEQSQGKIIEVVNPPTLPYELATYNEKASLRFKIQGNNQLEQEEKIDSIIFTTESEFEKKGTLKLVIEDPNFEEKKEETPIATNDQKPDEVNNDNTPETQSQISEISNEEESDQTTFA